MKTLWRKSILAYIYLSLVALPVDLANCQSTSEPKGATGVRAFLTSLYPELPTKETHLSITSSEMLAKTWTQLRECQFEVWQRPIEWPDWITSTWDERIRLTEFERLPLMKGDFELDDRGRLVELTVRDSFVVNSGKNADVRAWVGSHWDWNEAQGLQALKNAGPRYGPGEQEAFLKTIPLQVLERFLGKLSIQSAKFDTMFPAHQPVPTAVFFQWHVAVQGQRPDEPPVNYVLHFEPFGGTLTQIKAQR
jgi:hypothetical protein